MSKTYKVNVNQAYDFSFSSDEKSSSDIIATSTNTYHILDKNQSYQAEVIKSDFNRKTYTILVNGNSYEVKLSDELDVLISELGLEASAGKKENDVKAPMPGLIVSIDIAVGQEVAEGDGILVLEAMKMENTLTAPRDGVIKSIEVQAGDKVEKNMILIEME